MAPLRKRAAHDLVHSRLRIALFVDDRVVRSGVTEQQFTDFVKSTYRVLLTRGLRGCYVYFMDAQTRDFGIAVGSSG